MTATVLSILALVVAAIPIYFLAKSNAREAARIRQAAIESQVADATAPLTAKLSEQRETFRAQIEAIKDIAAQQRANDQRVIDRLEAENRDLVARNNKLEDDLRGAR